MESFEEIATGSDNHPIYGFEYYNNNTVNTPNYQTTYVDHWGYFNNSPQILPQCYTTECYMAFLHDSGQLNAYYNSRASSQDPDVNIMDMLKKIIYPTKGTAIFEYEPHTFSSQVERVPDVENGVIFGLIGFNTMDLGLNDFAGGLRIKKITTSPGNDWGTPITKEYFYVHDYQFDDNPVTLSTKLSSGQLQVEVQHPIDPNCVSQYNLCIEQRQSCIAECVALHNDPEALAECISYCPECEYNCYSYSRYLRSGNITNVGIFIFFTVHPELPLNDDHGNHIVYSEITEKNSNGGYTKFFYNTQSGAYPQYFDEIPITTRGNSFYSNLTSKLLERNTIKSTQLYDNVGNMAKRINYGYNPKPERLQKKIRTRSFQNVKMACTDDPFIWVPEGTANFIYFFNNYLENQVEIDLFNNTEISSTSTYCFDTEYDKRLRETTKTQSDGKLFSERYKYIADIDFSPLTSGCISTYLNCKQAARVTCDACLIGCQSLPTLEERTVCKLNCYDDYESDTSICRSEYNTCLDGINLPAKTRVIFTMQRKHMIGLPLESQKLVDNKAVGGKIFEYSTFPGGAIGDIYEPKIELSLNTDSPIANCQQIHLDSQNNLVYDLQYAPQLNFDSYSTKGNPLELYKESDVHTAYIWGYNDTYPVIKAENVSFSVLNDAVNAATGSLMNLLNEIGDMTTESQKTAWKTFNTILRTYSGLSNAMVTTYTYKPLVGLTSTTDPNGSPTYYEYDAFGRLIIVRDNGDLGGNIVKQYDYHYTTTPK